MSDAQFWFFEGKSVERLTDDLIGAGEGARLEIRPYGPDKLHLVVVPSGGKRHDPINDSHVCPGSPGCP